MFETLFCQGWGFWYFSSYCFAASIFSWVWYSILDKVFKLRVELRINDTNYLNRYLKIMEVTKIFYKQFSFNFDSVLRIFQCKAIHTFSNLRV